jgi:hypothetical protein
MTANDTRHRLADDEKRRRMEQIEAILRRLTPELTDEQLKKLMMQFRRDPAWRTAKPIACKLKPSAHQHLSQRSLRRVVVVIAVVA